MGIRSSVYGQHTEVRVLLLIGAPKTALQSSHDGVSEAQLVLSVDVCGKLDIKDVLLHSTITSMRCSYVCSYE